MLIGPRVSESPHPAQVEGARIAEAVFRVLAAIDLSVEAPRVVDGMLAIGLESPDDMLARRHHDLVKLRRDGIDIYVRLDDRRVERLEAILDESDPDSDQQFEYADLYRTWTARYRTVVEHLSRAFGEPDFGGNRYAIGFERTWWRRQHSIAVVEVSHRGAGLPIQLSMSFVNPDYWTQADRSNP